MSIGRHSERELDRPLNIKYRRRTYFGICVFLNLLSLSNRDILKILKNPLMNQSNIFMCCEASVSLILFVVQIKANYFIIYESCNDLFR